ncbi:cryptochrome/photolyase family protein [Parathalassolituus penaei]|uniref:Cryptochrome/photolyase family protein n=1 Tax=Parathalassolituus penaei TaxID=2997323 RepID=A0A9X3EF18_9GAMM|nr:cryptochrome/photolyase family protein [Parathalassolituus penaei]MCY0966056.1 cryptochrome/photolyase family protein [Parathalassolituus penaei]
MRMGLILGDQLSLQLPTLRVLNPQDDILVMAEVADETSYVPHHLQKIALIFSAMRHFANQLRQAGWRVHYHSYDPASDLKSLLAVVTHVQQQSPASEVVLTRCGEYRLQHSMDNHWSSQLGVPVTVFEDDRFICPPGWFQQWASQRKQLRMEFFYREMRRLTGLLMVNGEPAGGEWNLDHNNRNPWKGSPPLPAHPVEATDSIDQEVLALVQQHFSHHPGQLQPFYWPTTRAAALDELQRFLDQRLPWFGDFQDAMVTGEDFLFHSRLSAAINIGLLDPLEVCRAAEQAWQQGKAPLNAVEGFIRQIIGWREYVREIYWLKMPDYAQLNHLGYQRSLPRYYWDGNTRMKCMSECFRTTFDHAWAHHIQRLMITGNFALLAGIRPVEICDWYLAVYADAFDWVELPNTLGMVMHADGGLLGSKPYAASGQYINRMSDYCRNCHYKVKTAADANSCPFNSLYWHFIEENRQHFEKNPRMTMIYKSLERQKDEQRQRVQERARYLLEHLDEL